MAQKIHLYPTERLTFGDDDYYDIDYYDSGSGTYATAKIKGSTIKTAIQSGLANIYQSDGTLTTDRVVSTGGYDFLIRTSQGVTAGDVFLIDDSTNQVIIGGDQSISPKLDVSGDAKMLKLILTDSNSPTIIEMNDDSTGNLIGITFEPITQNRQQTFQDADGTIALLEDVPVLSEYQNFASTQWSDTLTSPVPLANGDIANGCTFFTSANKVAGGTTSYDEYDIAFGIEIELSGTSGTLDIEIDGVTYTATFNSDLTTTAEDWVVANKTALNAVNIRVFALPTDPTSIFGSKEARIRFCGRDAILDAITLTNTSGNLNGTLSNPFTGSPTSVPDHILIPYVGTAYENLRLHHNFRVNFEFVTTGGTGVLALSLRRFEDDTRIGSDIQINKNNDVGGVQETFISYTAGATDPFVIGGFYFLLINTSGGSVSFTNGVGILVQTEYQNPVKFP